jgi:hypothetical protein
MRVNGEEPTPFWLDATLVRSPSFQSTASRLFVDKQRRCSLTCLENNVEFFLLATPAQNSLLSTSEPAPNLFCSGQKPS